MSRWRTFNLLVLLALAAAAAAGWLIYKQATIPFKGYTEPEKFVSVNRGLSVPQIGAELQKAGVVRSGTPLCMVRQAQTSGRIAESGRVPL